MSKDLRIKLKIDSDTGELVVTQKEFGKLSKVIDKSSDSAKSFGQTLRSIAGYAAVGYTIKQGFDAIVFAAKDFTNTASEFEKYGSTLETIEGSSVKARDSLKWIENFAKKTPYELSQVTEAFVQMRAYGLNPTDGSLKSLGDAASAMNKPIMQAVEAMADAMTGENERLKEFGIRASKKGEEIAYNWTDSSGKAKHIIIKNNSEIIKSTLESIFNSKYQDAMQNQMSTYDGMISNLRDQWVQFKKDFMDAGLFAYIKAFIKTFTESFNQSFNLVSGGYESLTNIFISGFKTTIESLAIVYQSFKSLKIVFNLITVSFKTAVGSILAGISLLSKGLNTVIEAYNAGASVLNLEPIEFKFNDQTENINKLKESIKEDMTDISDALKDGLAATGIAESFNANLMNNYSKIKNETDKLVDSIKPTVNGSSDGQFQFNSSNKSSETKTKKESKEKNSTEQFDTSLKAYNDFLEDKKRVNRYFEDDFNKSLMTQTQYQIYELNKQKEEYSQYVEDKNRLDIWYESEFEQIQKNRADIEKNGLDGIKEAFDDYIQHAGNSYRQMNNLFSNALYGMEDFLVDFIKTGKASFSDFINSIAEDFIRMMIQTNITKPLATAASSVDWGSMFSGFAFANGGVMTNQGAVPLKAYSNGGIANTPQFAIFGEGRMPEAYVPLPDGRTIPVTMKNNQSSTNIVLNIENKTGQSIDASQISQMTKVDSDGKKVEVISIIMDAYNRNVMQFRDLLNGGR